MRGPLAGVRLGVPQQFAANLDSGMQNAFEAALARLRNAGAVLVRAPLPVDAAVCPDIAGTIIGYENLATVGAYLEGEGTGLSFEDVIAQASPNLQKRYAAPAPTRAEYEEALRGRVRAVEAIGAHFRSQRIDALAFPPVMAPAPPLGDNPEIRIGDAMVPIRTVVGRNTALGNCASLASLVIPAGLTSGGLPVAVEFDMLPGRDHELLALGLALEQALGPIPAPVPLRA